MYLKTAATFLVLGCYISLYSCSVGKMGTTTGAQSASHTGILWKLCGHCDITTHFRIFSRRVWMAFCVLRVW